jgi:hypothetical protein
MSRNIKMLHNFKPPATDEEIRASSLQFVRKLSGFTRPSKANELVSVTNAPPRDREVAASKAAARTAKRFHGPVAAG